jgi:putative flippase GtrA
VTTTDNALQAGPPPTPAAGLPAQPAPALPTVVPAPAAPEPAPAPRGLMGRLRGLVDVLAREMMKFGAVGALAFVVDTYVYNLLRVGIWPITEAPLGHKTVLCKVISVSVATVVAWLGNRYWTFRHRRREAARGEFVLYGVMNVGGLLIAAACLAFSHYVLGLHSPLADNIAANVVGLVLGTLFRFWAYRQFVFTDLRKELDPSS